MEPLTLHMIALVIVLFIDVQTMCVLTDKSRGDGVRLLACLTMAVAVAAVAKIILDIISL